MLLISTYIVCPFDSDHPGGWKQQLTVVLICISLVTNAKTYPGQFRREKQIGGMQWMVQK